MDTPHAPSPLPGDPANGHLLRSAEAVDSILTRLDAIERQLARIGPALDAVAAVPAAAATAVDAVDGVAGRLRDRGVDVEQRLDRLLRLAERLTDDRTTALLEAALTLAPDVPGLAAMLVDVLDEQARRLADEGLDLEASLANGVRAALHFGALIGPNELDTLHALLSSDVLAPGAVAAVSDAATALQATRTAPPQPVGLLGLARALRDPEVRRAAGFLVSMARNFGRTLPR